MGLALDEFYAAVEEEFGLAIDDDARQALVTPGAVIDFVAEESQPSDGMTIDEHRDHVAAVIDELMAECLGVTVYTEGSRFLQDLRVR
jgi:hypothetical protein